MTENAARADRYKETVFLPRTDFPMRGGLPQKEPEILAKWQEIDLYAALRKASERSPRFTLHDGPPYANGHIHIGHALNKILKDVVTRTQQSRGKDAAYVPGWDCHGLPIEWKIEEQYREKGLNKDDVDILSFRAECRAFARKWVDIQAEEFKRLGVTGDWENPYLTMNVSSEGKIAREIHKFLKNGLLYKGAKPVMWSTVEKTALAEAEVEYKEHKSITVWVTFPVAESPLKALAGASIVIWTTTPWTLPSNRAIAFGPDIEYGVFTVSETAAASRLKQGEKIAVALPLAEEIKAKGGITEWKQEAVFKGSALSGTVCHHPLREKGYDFPVPLLAGDFVTADAGTGFVHVAPSHGEDDFYLFLKHFGAKDVPDNLTDDGKFRDHVPLFAGLAVYTEKGEMGEGNFAVLKALDEAGALLAKGSIRHEYPHSWRSKAPLIFRTTPQWFIAMDKPMPNGKTLRETALAAIGQTRWVPAQGENRIRAMIENRPDWCISRQRAWGVPIALFLDKKTGEPLADDAVLNRIGDIFEKEGCDAWWARPAADFLGGEYDAADFDQVFDIVDVWFESGSTHAFVLDKKDVPADLYLEGSDQHRGWFHSSLLESCGTNGHAPYRAVLTHGFILDEKGYKMSKSLGNVVAPQDIIAQYGADILRLWSVISDYAEDVRIGAGVMQNVSDLYRRLRNTLRFLLGALDGFTPQERVMPDDFEKLPSLERYMLHLIAETEEKLQKDLARHDYGRMMMTLHHFANSELSSFYFDIRKDSLYCDAEGGMTRRGCRTVMAHLLDFMLSWLSPVLCFTAEEAYSHRPPGILEEAESVHLRAFPLLPPGWKNEALAAKWTLIRDVRRAVLGALEQKRADKTIGASLEAAPFVFVSEAHEKALAGVNLAEICITSQAGHKAGDGEAEDFRLKDVPGVAVSFRRAEGEKCERCWQIQPDVAADGEYAGLCSRCAAAVRSGKSARKVA